MNAKTYQAATMSQALAEVKQDLGREAVILHTRRFRKGGLLGIGGREIWEVTASAMVNVIPRPPKGEYVPVDRDEGGAAKRPSPAGGRGRDVLRDEVQEIRNMMRTLVAGGRRDASASLPAGLGKLRERLLGQDVPGGVVDDLINQLRGSMTGQELEGGAALAGKLRETVAGRIPVCAQAERTGGDRHARVVALIGPTGVGKTTTIAKLAANYKLREGCNVGLITIDTYRIAAVDQLRTYAEIIKVPLQAVLTAGELHKAIHAMCDMDVVLVDTAGRSQNNQMRLNQLRGFIAAAAPDEVHLAVAATSNQACVRSTLRRFLPLGVNRIVLTKVDEAATFGTILTIADRCKLGFSYVTTGQDVPEDIAPADPRIMSDWIIEGGLYAD